MKRFHYNLSIYKQRGAALLILAIIFILSATLIMVGNRSRNKLQLEQQNNIYQILEAAKYEMIGFAVQNNNVPGMLPFPDRNADTPGHDGLGDCSGNTTFPPITTSLLIGRYPYRGQENGTGGCTDNFASFDNRGYADLHYVVSPNLIQYFITPTRNTINANVLNESGWLTVYDAKGNPTTDVAFIIFYPGNALTTALGHVQSHSPLAGPAEYLDAFTLPPPLSLTIDNANPTNALEFVQGDKSDTFNDRLVFVTATDLLRAVEHRMLNAIATQMRTDYSSTGYPPTLAALDNDAAYNNAADTPPYFNWISGTNNYASSKGGVAYGSSFTLQVSTTCINGGDTSGCTTISPIDDIECPVGSGNYFNAVMTGLAALGSQCAGTN